MYSTGGVQTKQTGTSWKVPQKRTVTFLPMMSPSSTLQTVMKKNIMLNCQNVSAGQRLEKRKYMEGSGREEQVVRDQFIMRTE